MEIRHTPALILKSIDWSETSKILTCFSKEFVKISLMVRGAKRPKSSFRGLCEPLHHIDLIYDFKELRDLNSIRKRCKRIFELGKENKLQHFDLKLDNILLTAGNVPKIVDFGLSVRF